MAMKPDRSWVPYGIAVATFALCSVILWLTGGSKGYVRSLAHASAPIVVTTPPPPPVPPPPPPPPPGCVMCEGPVSVTVVRAGIGRGTVTSTPPGIVCGTDCSETWPAGTGASLTATPEAGWTFLGWSGACSGTGVCAVGPVVGPGEGSVSVTATFGIIVPALTRPTVVDFETPALGALARQPINPYVARGMTFTAEPTGYVGAVGVVRNNALATCVGSLSDANQLLGTGVDGAADSIGKSSFAIRATPRAPLAPPVVVSAQFQTGAGVPIRIRLFDVTGSEVGSAAATAAPAPRCDGFGFSGKARVTLTASRAVAYALLDVGSETGRYIFAVDDFEAISVQPLKATLTCPLSATSGVPMAVALTLDNTTLEPYVVTRAALGWHLGGVSIVAPRVLDLPELPLVVPAQTTSAPVTLSVTLPARVSPRTFATAAVTLFGYKAAKGARKPIVSARCSMEIVPPPAR